MSRSHPNFSTVADAWITVLRAKACSPNTELAYRCALKNLRLYLARHRVTETDRVTAAHLDDWQRQLLATGRASATLEAFTKIVQRWFAWQVATGRMFADPALGLTAPKARPAFGRCPSEEAMRNLLKSIRGKDRFSLRDRAILEIAYSTGARLEELARLDLSSLDLRERTVRLFGKGNRERMVPLTRAAMKSLRVYLRRVRSRFLNGVKDQPALWVGLRGARRMARAAISQAIKRRGRSIGLLIAPHDIRRAFATHLLAAGAHPTAVKELLGHSGYSHLRRYLRLHPMDAITTARNSKISR